VRWSKEYLILKIVAFLLALLLWLFVYYVERLGIGLK